MDTLDGGGKLTRGESMTSPNGRFELKMQEDGNVVLYDGTKPTWATNTQRDDAERLVMQDDGNFVVYTGKDKAVWSSRTSGNKGASLKLQDDGNLVVYPTSGKPLWASATLAPPMPPVPATPIPAGSATPATPMPADATTASTKAMNATAIPGTSPATAATKTANKRTYTVAKGDSLWRIAEKFYGSGSDFKKIAKANNISDPDHIRPGQELVIPE
jgi:nucleoid-associated protein YgaU